MKENHPDIREQFPLIQQLMKDAFHTDCYLYTYPYDDFSKIDHGFRKIVWDEYPRPVLAPQLDVTSLGYRLLVIQSSLGFYNVIAFVSSGEHPDFISVGPFRGDDLSLRAYQHLLQKKTISADFMSIVQQFYRVLPLAKVTDVVAALLHLTAFSIPEFADVIPEIINYSETRREVIVTEENVAHFSTQYAENYAHHVADFLQSLASGHINQVSEH